MSNWWDDPAYDHSKPMNFPRQDDGPTVPVKIEFGCNQPEHCKCKGLRIYKAKKDNLKVSCKCQEDRV